MLAGGDEWLRPNDEEDAFRRQIAQAMLEIIKAMLHFVGERNAGFGNAEHVRQSFYGGEDIRNGVRIGGVGGNSEFIERLRCFQAIEGFGGENQIGVERSNHFQAGIDSAADSGFFLGVGWVVAVVGVANEAILKAEGVDGFGQAGRERNDAANRLRDANGAAGFIDDFAKGGRFGGKVSGTLRVRRRRCTSKNGQNSNSCRVKARRQQLFQNSPTISARNSSRNKKAPRDAPGLPASPFLAKGAGLCAKGGWPGLRLLEPITVAGPRPIRTAFPASPAAKLKTQCKPG